MLPWGRRTWPCDSRALSTLSPAFSISVTGSSSFCHCRSPSPLQEKQWGRAALWDQLAQAWQDEQRWFTHSFQLAYSADDSLMESLTSPGYPSALQGTPLLHPWVPPLSPEGRGGKKTQKETELKIKRYTPFFSPCLKLQEQRSDVITTFKIISCDRQIDQVGRLGCFLSLSKLIFYERWCLPCLSIAWWNRHLVCHFITKIWEGKAFQERKFGEKI